MTKQDTQKNTVEVKKNSSKTGFSCFSFQDQNTTDKYIEIINKVNDIINGKIFDPVKDSAHLTDIELPNDKKETTKLQLNKHNLDIIFSKHGGFEAVDIVIVANEFDNGVYIIENREGKIIEKINLVKHTNDGYFILAANRFNGFSVVTFFERFPKTNKTLRYLENILLRGAEIKNKNTTFVGDISDTAVGRHSYNSLHEQKLEGAGNEPFQPRNNFIIPNQNQKSNLN